MNANDVLIDLLEDNRRRLGRVLQHLPDESLYWQPERENNPIAVIIWHMARIFDVFLVQQAQGKGSEEEFWFRQGWAQSCGYDPRGLGLNGWGMLTGYTLEDVAAIPHFGRDVVVGYLDAVYDEVGKYIARTPIDVFLEKAGEYTRYQHIQMALLDNVRHLGEITALKASWERQNQAFDEDIKFEVPILEFDPAVEAFIEPSKVTQKRDMPEHCVICFFMDVIEEVAATHGARILAENRWEDGPHRVYEIGFRGQRLAFFQPGIGAPMSASLLEEVIAFGCRKFIACGGCGVLEKDIATGHLIVVSAALRDEGASYHYLPSSREVLADPQGVKALVDLLEARGVPHLVGKTWTTSAPYRETPAKIRQRKQEGCLVVEMEAAAMMAVAQFRRTPFGQILYAGDDLSGSQWDRRGWQSLSDVRKQLFWLAADAVLSL